MKRRSLFSLMALSLLGLPLQGKEAIDPKAKTILEDSIKALGGMDKLKAVKTRVIKGKMMMPAQGMSMEMTLTQKAPDKSHSKMKMGEMMTVEQAYDGKEAWMKNSMAPGIQKLKGEQLTRAKDSAAMFGELDIIEKLASAKTLSDLTEGDRTLKGVEITTTDGQTKTLYFDSETKLLSKVKLLGGGQDMEMNLKDYKEVDGIKCAHTLEMVMGVQKMEMKFEKIENNIEVDDKIFTAEE